VFVPLGLWYSITTVRRDLASIEEQRFKRYLQDARANGVLSIYEPSFTKKQLDQLRGISGIRQVEVQGGDVSDLVVSVSTMPDLQRISVVDGTISADAVSALDEASSLTEIELLRCDVSPSVIGHLASLPGLRSLTIVLPEDVSSESRRAAIIQRLAGFHQLDRLAVGGFDEDDIDQLVQSLPNIDIARTKASGF
jgi:hypothetical protein